MSGDVFGNGMLLSPHIKLVAAFDHRHIFIDPAPDPATSFAERKRLFDLPRSSWMDYDKTPDVGGRRRLRPRRQVDRAVGRGAPVLGIEAPTMTPLDLMRAILTAPVDLLYFGGIGTYVKASSESHADAGDRTNDAAARQRRRSCAPAWSARAPISASPSAAASRRRSAGRKINTDALDNSAGVDASDHEVNIKIVTGERDRSGALAARTATRCCSP